ncbi:EboA domain-containing protein [Robiginitalea sp.]|nr:EboA domain-containing protein [Robiginitalea sp.]
MKTTIPSETLRKLLFANLEPVLQEWLTDKLVSAINPPSARDLFLTYTLIGRKFTKNQVVIEEEFSDSATFIYLKHHQITLDQLARIYVLNAALESEPEYFVPKIGTLMQVADTGELIAFLRYLCVLQRADAFTTIAVDALRTNISDVFDAIALANPYPEQYFNEGQWNQMYLKAAFMQRDLLGIQGVNTRANAALTKIISDYAHERWAASRDIDPHIWQPVSHFLDEVLLSDMKRLLNSSQLAEQRAGYLCCMASKDARAKTLIARHPVKNEYESQPFDWHSLNT